MVECLEMLKVEEYKRQMVATKSLMKEFLLDKNKYNDK